MSNATCFEPRMLKDYLLGKLPDEQSDVISAHLEACLSCEATVAQLDRASDTLTDGLRLPIAGLVGEAAPSVERKSDIVLKQALSQVQSIDAAWNVASQSRVSPNSVINPASLNAINHSNRDPATEQSPVLRDYRLLAAIGSGGMGTVYKAVHTRLDRLVAVKLLPARRLGDEQAVARFQREMRVIGQLSHPAIVQATDAGEVDGTHFLVMEYVEGLDLNRIAKACGTLSIADACEVARQTALGLEYAHQQGIVHRDIKPSNVMLSVVSRPLSAVSGRPHDRPLTTDQSPRTTDNGPTLKILDLGLALLSGEQAPVDELTTVGQLMGTLDYMAPEQLEDSHQVGPRADIYALAATLYRLLTGSAPFAKEDRKTPLQKLRALATLTVMPIRERRADIPEALALVIDRALLRDQEQRFESMQEFATALAPWCAGHDLGRLALTASQMAEPLPDTPTNWQRSQIGERQSRKSLSMSVPHGEPECVSLRTSVMVRGLTPPGSPIDVGHQIANATSLAENAQAIQQPPRRKLGLIALALMLFVVFGVVITLETNKGQLIVESVRDGVEVRVKRSGKVIDNLEITTGSKSSRLAAGEYEIEIVGETDGLSIQNGKFVLTRGGVVIAKVVEVPKGQANAGEADARLENDKDELPTPRLETTKPAPVEIVDRNAKGMETFEAANPDWAAEKKLRDTLRVKMEVNFVDSPLTDCIAFLQDSLSATTKSDIRILLDTAALADAKITTDTPITLTLANIGASDVLEIMLRRLNCVWQIDNGQILITAKSKENETLVTRTYPVGKLMPGVRQAVARIAAEQPKAINAGGGFFSIGASTDVGRALLPAMLATTGTSARPTVAAHRPEIILCQGGGGGFGGGGFGGGHLPPAAPNEASHLSELLGMLGHEWQNSAGKGGSVNLLGNMLVVRHSRKAHADIESLIRTIEAAFLKPLTESAEIRPIDYPLEADAFVRQQLAKNMEVNLTDSPLTDVTAYMADLLNVQVLIDHERLDEAKITTDEIVTLTLNNVTGEVALLRMLKPLQLTTRVDRGVLVITTIAAEQQHLLTKVYDVRNLLARGLTPSGLLTSLQETGTSGPWQNQNPEKTSGRAMIFADTLLVMSQSATNHEDATKFLASLKAQLSDRPEVPLANVAELPSGEGIAAEDPAGTKRGTTKP
ncbi:MAG: serine/threonine-protein kinase [Planctomycetia bacterium]|nr:serine/threonine-protein kinase [Planctomycetia bacterium]